MIKTAVVILNWNGEAMLRQFLPSVIACSRLEGTEIYVADNASTDASCEVVEKRISFCPPDTPGQELWFCRWLQLCFAENRRGIRCPAQQ